MSVVTPSPLSELDQIADAAEAHLGVSVVTAAPLARRGMMSKKLAGSVGGMLGRAMAKKVAKERAGGLPESFLLAVTTDEVVVIACRNTRKPPFRELEGEAARFPRAGMRASAERVGPYQLHVSLTPAGAETLNLAMGDAPVSHAFVALLNGDAR